MNRTAAIAVLTLVMASFIGAIVTYVLGLGSNRAIGALLVGGGVIAAAAAPYVVEGHRIVRQRVFALARPSVALRTFTVVLWGCGIAMLGAFLFFEV